MTSGFTRFFKSYFVLYNIMSMYVLFILARALIVSFAGAKVRRFFNSANFLTTFFEVFLRRMVKWLEIRGYGSKVFWGGMGGLRRLGGLGQVRVRAAQAIMGQVR